MRACIIALASLAAMAPAAAQAPVRLTVHDRALHEVDRRLFGHFLERPSWGGEIGPEAAVDPATGLIDPDVVRLLETMAIPLLRFPGGTDVDYMDWTDMIGRAPGRAQGAGRPASVGTQGDTVTNAFGIDEALGLAEHLGSEMILVVNLGDAVLGQRTVEEAARHAAGLVAYANAAVGEPLPAGMPDWPAIRAENGRAEPYGVRYFEIGNEVWLFDNPAGDGRLYSRDGPIPEAVADAYFDAVRTYVDAMRAVDPDIEVIIDGDVPALTERVRAELGDRVQYLAHHSYYPWAMRAVERGGEAMDVDDLEPTPEAAVWYGWASPRYTDAQGLASLDGDRFYEAIAETGYPVAVTEWNWNGWWQGDGTRGLLTSQLAQGLGAAGYLHAFIREGDRIALANQSMLVGRSWGITGIRYDADAGTAVRYPTGAVTSFYARHSGDERVALDHSPLPTYVQPYRMSGIRPDTVALLDPVATRRGDTVYVHVINRHLTDALPLVIDASAFGAVEAEAQHHVFTGSPTGELHAEPNPAGHREVAYETSTPVRFSGRELRVEAPPHTVSTFEFIVR